MLSLGTGEMKVLNTGTYKDISNHEEDATVNTGEKYPERTMINKVL